MLNDPPIFQNPQADGGSFFWPGQNDDTCVLIFHGFTATTIEVRPLAKILNQNGYSVSGPLLPGHGVSPDELNLAKYTDWIIAAEDAYQQLAKKYKYVFVAGESMGGLVTLWLAAHHPEIRGILLFAPALHIKKLWMSHFVWPFKNYIYKKNIDLDSPWQGFNVIPFRASAQLNIFQGKVKSNLRKINQPALVFQGKLDGTIDPLSSVQVLEGLSSEEKELVWLEESSHCILLDRQLELVEKMSLEFIQKWSQ